MAVNAQLVLILTGNPRLGEVLTAAVRQRISGADAISIPFERCSSLLTPRLLYEAGLLVVDLFRHYPGGLRAEGVALAQRRWQRKRGFMIVSPLYLPVLNCPGYWDISAKDSLAERAGLLATNPIMSAERFGGVVSCFDRFLRLPPQHD